MTTAWAALLPLILVIGVDLWVYSDAKRCAAAGSPVYLRMGRLAIETPIAWLVACLLFSILFVPSYVVARSRS